MNPPLSFDNREGIIWYNNEYVQWADAKVHVLNHGLHYASAVFEGIRAYSGVIFKLKEHIDRLFNGADTLNMPITYSKQMLIDASNTIIKRNNITNGYIRPIAFRGSEEISVGCKGCSVHVAIATWEWSSPLVTENGTDSIQLLTSQWRRPPPESSPFHAKGSGIYILSSLSMREANDAGFNDALILDYRGLIADTTSTNVFIVIDGALHTPLPDCFLNGITRQTIIELAQKRGIDVHERHITPQELTTANEVFVTGTAAEILPVSRVDNQDFEIGNITTTLKNDYHRLVNSQ